jgi:hypothetical protein
MGGSRLYYCGHFVENGAPMGYAQGNKYLSEDPEGFSERLPVFD